MTSTGTSTTLPARAPGITLYQRFRLQRLLARSASAESWLALDAKSGQTVMLKLLGGVEHPTVWLETGRRIAQLAHPHLVPVLEAVVLERQPCLLQAHVAGQTFAEILRQRGVLPAREVVALMLGVLDALATAHAAGVVHGNLTLSSVLVDAQGAARVSDFGALEGGRRPAATPAVDLFAAALLLTELLTGQPVLAERDPLRAYEWARDKTLAFPAGLEIEINEALRALALRALARGGAQAFGSVAELRDALRQWQAQNADNEADDDNAGVRGVFARLLARMRERGDFPALSSTILRIHSISSSDNESQAGLTNEILKDVALTNKLLRLVNTVHYARGGSISTVSRAVSLVGFNGIRNLTLSLILLEHMKNQEHADLLREEFLRALMAASIARGLAGSPVEEEEVFIGAMFQNLGRMLAEYYFPDEARHVWSLCGGEQPVNELAAAREVFGLSYEQLGSSVAKAWNLPEIIRLSIRKPAGRPPMMKSSNPHERIRWIAAASNDMAEILLRENVEDRGALLAQAGARYGRCIGASARAIDTAVLRAREHLSELTAVAGLTFPPDSPAGQLLDMSAARTETPSALGSVLVQDAAAAPADAPITTAATAAAPEPAADSAEALARERRTIELLMAGIQDVTNAMVEDFKLGEVLRMILETMLRAMEFDTIVFCMRDARTNALTGRFGLGKGVEGIVKSFNIPCQPSTTNLFAAICVKGADTLISHARDPHLANRLPAWYRSVAGVPSSFLLLPLMHKGAPIGLIYADVRGEQRLKLSEKQLALLRTLRNQAVMGMRSAS